MHKFTAMLAVVVSLVLVGVTGQGELMPPERPSRFRSPGDLRRYLKALNEYYAIVGRPRFGRSATNKKTVGGRSGWTKE